MNLNKLNNIRITITIFLILFAYLANSQDIASNYGNPHKIIESPNIFQFQHLSWPKMEICEDGTIVVGLCAGYRHTESNCPAVAISHDGGKNFGSLDILKYYESTTFYQSCGNLAIGKTKNDSIILLTMAFSSERNNIYGWKLSDVKNEKWDTVDTESLGPNKTGSVFGKVMQVGDSLAVVGHYRKGSTIEKGIWISYSKDGNHWGNPYLITEGDYYEPVVIYTDGQFIGVTRIKNEFGSNTYADVWSEDGINWIVKESKIKEDKDIVLPSPCLFVDSENASKIYAVVTVRDYRKDRETATDGFYLWEKDLNSQDWTKKTQLIKLSNVVHGVNDFGYPWVVSKGNDDYFMVFYFGELKGANSIWAMDFKINEVK